MATPTYRTLEEVRAETLAIADVELDAFITADFVDDQIRRAIEELHEKMADAAPTTLTDYIIVQTVPQDELMELPPETFQLMGLDWRDDSDRWRRIDPVDFLERNFYQWPEWGPWRTRVRYQLTVDNKIRFFPSPQQAFDVRCWIIEYPTLPTGDADELVLPNGWDQYVVWTVVQVIRTKAEAELGEVLVKRQEVYERILRAARKTDRKPLRVRNVKRGRGRNRYADWDWYYW